MVHYSADYIKLSICQTQRKNKYSIPTNMVHKRHVGYCQFTLIQHLSSLYTLQWRQPFNRAQTKENINAPRHRPLWGEFTGDWLIPAQMANVSIWWRHHEMCDQCSVDAGWGGGGGGWGGGGGVGWGVSVSVPWMRGGGWGVGGGGGGWGGGVGGVGGGGGGGGGGGVGE